MRNFLLGVCLFLLSQLESCSSSSSLGTFWLDSRINGICQYHVIWKMYLDLTLDFLLLDTYCLHRFPGGNADIRTTQLSMEVLTTTILVYQVWIYFQQITLVERKKCLFEAKISIRKWTNEIQKNTLLLVIYVQEVGVIFMANLTKVQQRQAVIYTTINDLFRTIQTVTIPGSGKNIFFYKIWDF